MSPVRRQSTISAPAVCAGVSLHSGRHARMAIKPSPVGSGLRFIRTDVTDRDNRIDVKPQNVSSVKNCTTIANKAGVSVATIEHFMAALAATGIDNLTIDIDGDELPALDGSSEPFLKLIEQVGIKRQPAPRRYIKVLKRVEVFLGKSHAIIEPSDDLLLDVTIDFEDKAIGLQRVEIATDVRSFRERLASARTFARAHEVAALQAAGLSKGGSLDNAILVDGAEILNPEGLRFTDEFVRHKALDLMGDLYVSGPTIGKITTIRGGHAINHALLTKFFADPQSWKFVTIATSQDITKLETVLA